VISSASFVALRHRNFRLIWAGLLLSFTGSMMQNAALLWHVSLLVRPNAKGSRSAWSVSSKWRRS
jgi:hypothetical protein